MLARIKTSIGEVEIKRAETKDEEAVLGVMRDAAKWLEGKGINQWKGMLSESGRSFVRKRVQDRLAYIAILNGEKIGTVSILWEDHSVWGEKGLDGSAGYIHGLAILRRFEGKQVGEGILNWSMDNIRTQKPLVRLDCMAENLKLCSYYEEKGFVLMCQKSFPNGWKANLYEKG